MLFRSTDLNNADGFEAVCEQAIALGFDGKSLVHPSQVEPCNRLFSPTAQVVAEARDMIAAWEAAQARGDGVVVVNGKMVEELHVEEARRTLETNRLITELST